MKLYIPLLIVFGASSLRGVRGQSDADKFTNGIGNCRDGAANTENCFEQTGEFDVDGVTETFYWVWGQDVATTATAKFQAIQGNENKRLEVYRPVSTLAALGTFCENNLKGEVQYFSTLSSPGVSISTCNTGWNNHPYLSGGYIGGSGNALYAHSEKTGSGLHTNFCGDPSQAGGVGFNSVTYACLAVVRDVTNPGCTPSDDTALTAACECGDTAECAIGSYCVTGDVCQAHPSDCTALKTLYDTGTGGTPCCSDSTGDCATWKSAYNSGNCCNL